MSSKWMLVSCNADKLEDLAHPEIEVFTSVYDHPSPGDVADAIRRLLGPPRRQPGDWLRESYVVLIPLADMQRLGTMRNPLVQGGSGRGGRRTMRRIFKARSKYPLIPVAKRGGYQPTAFGPPPTTPPPKPVCLIPVAKGETE